MGKTTSLEVKSSDTISMVIAKIHDKDGIPVEQQMLFSGGKELNNSYTFAGCHITVKGKTITLEVKGTDTIGDLKTKIKDAEAGVLPDDMNLVYNGQQLDNGLTLASYYIYKESTLNLFVIDRGPMEIFIKAVLTGNTIKTLEVHSSNTISNLKALIEDSEGILIDQQMLLIDGNQLHDHQVLANYNIQKESTIYLLPLSRGVVQTLIKMPEKAIIMKVESLDTIGNLKAKIQEVAGIPSDQQVKLLFKGKELDNCCKIADYNIHWNSVLHLEPGSDTNCRIPRSLTMA
nr:polyubiquitin [Tanacetum cinerariifolium]